MSAFISGILIYNRPSAVDEGRVYDRRLVLQLPRGPEIYIYDPFDPIAEGLKLGERYEVVLFAQLPNNTAYVPDAASADLGYEDTSGEWWTGIIRDLHWRAADRTAYRWAHEAIFGHISGNEYVLLETPWGLMVTDCPSVDHFARASGLRASQVGDALQWEFARHDLLAVV